VGQGIIFSHCCLITNLKCHKRYSHDLRTEFTLRKI
jgi:hypothetical protein